MPKRGDAMEGRCEIAAAWGWYCPPSSPGTFDLSRASGEERAQGCRFQERFAAHFQLHQGQPETSGRLWC